MQSYLESFPPLAITSIETNGLFGRYDYSLDLAPRSDLEALRLAILYGENGTGKTTVPRFLFHLLSPENNRGHRTQLIRIPVRRVQVSFANQLTVLFQRRQDEIVGSYKITIADPENKAVSGEFIEDDGTLQDRTTSPRRTRVAERLEELALPLIFLSDDRILQSDLFPVEADDAHASWRLARLQS